MLKQAYPDRAAKAEHVMIHTPEMSITGYDCGDLFKMDPEKLNARIQESLRRNHKTH